MGLLWLWFGAGYLADKGMPALPIGGLDSLGQAQGLTLALSLEMPLLTLDVDKGQAWANSQGVWYEVDYSAAKSGQVGLCRAYALKDGAWELWIDATVVGPPAQGASACERIDGLPELGFVAEKIDGLPELGF